MSCPQCGRAYACAYETDEVTSLDTTQVEAICFSPENSGESMVYIHKEGKNPLGNNRTTTEGEDE